MKTILISIFCLSILTVSGQQYSLNSQYLFNEAAFNPAAAGAKDYIPIHFNFRSQWTGFDGAPSSQMLTSHADLGKNLGFGGNLYNDVSGPSRSTGINLMLSYRLRLSKNNLHGLRFGLAASFSQHAIDVDKLTYEVQDDAALTRQYNNQFVPDADLGIYYTFADKGFAGISAKNLVQMNKDLFDFNNVAVNTMKRHYYFIGGYNFGLGENVKLKTATLLRYIESKPFQFDVTLIGEYKEFLWLGAGYRNLDAVSVLGGFQVGIFKCGYAYDFTLSDIRNYSSGSHEVFLELQLGKNKKSNGSATPWNKRNRIYSQPAMK